MCTFVGLFKEEMIIKKYGICKNFWSKKYGLNEKSIFIFVHIACDYFD
jgi:hypothetical protein